MKPAIPVLILIVLMILTGCSSAVRGVQNRHLTVDAYLLKPVFLSPETRGTKIFVQITNISGVAMDLEQVIRNALETQGLQVVADPAQAEVVVAGNLSYFGNALDLNPSSSRITQLENLQVMGDTASVISGVNTLSQLGASGINAAVMGGGINLASGLVAKSVHKTFEVKEYAGVIDLEITERKANKVHVTRLIATVKQTHLKEDKVLAAVQGEFAAKLVKIFPQS